MFGYDRREILYKDILSLSVSTVHIGVYAIYDIYVFLFVCVLSKGCNNQAYGLHLAWLEWIRSRWRYILLHVFQQGPGVYKEEKDVMQVSYSGFI